VYRLQFTEGDDRGRIRESGKGKQWERIDSMNEKLVIELAHAMRAAGRNLMAVADNPNPATVKLEDAAAIFTTAKKALLQAIAFSV
jgi:hypothetical protein